MAKQRVIVTWFYIPHVCDYLVPPMRKKRLLKIQKCPTQTIEQFPFWKLNISLVVTFHMFTSSPIPHFWKANMVIVTQCHPPLTTLDWLCMINFSNEQLQLGSTESTKGSNRVLLWNCLFVKATEQGVTSNLYFTVSVYYGETWENPSEIYE